MSRPFRTSRVEPHELAAVKALDVDSEVCFFAYNSSNNNSNSAGVNNYNESINNNNNDDDDDDDSKVNSGQLFESRPVKSHIPPLERHTRKAPVSQFIAGSDNAIAERRIEIKFKVKRKIHPKGYYYRCCRTPAPMSETLKELTPSVLPKAIAIREASTSDMDDDQSADSLDKKTKGAHSALIGFLERRGDFIGDRQRNGSTLATKKKKKILTSAVLDYTEFEVVTEGGGIPKSVTKMMVQPEEEEKSKKGKNGKRKYTKRQPGARKKGIKSKKGKRNGRRPWKWFACKKCLSCLRTKDCGKCGQCRHSDVGICILRQCIMPVRIDDQTPKRILSDDDESLPSREDVVSDLEWDDAFPEEVYGKLTPEDLENRWSKIPDDATASNIDTFSFMPGVSI